MSAVLMALVWMLAGSAVISFFIAFFWQAKVIFTVFGERDSFGRFLAGEVFPELRRKWIKAIAYVAISYATLFLVAGFLEKFGPK